MIIHLILPSKIIIFDKFALYWSNTFKSISPETQSKQKWMEVNCAPPQRFAIFVRLSLLVHWAAESWQTITGYLMASVFAVSTPAGLMRVDKKPQFIPPVHSYYCCACMSFSFLPFANSPCPLCGDYCSYLLPPPHYSGFVKSFLVIFLQPEAISTFTSEPALISFAKFFCRTSEDNNFVSWDIEIDIHECSWSDFTVRSLPGSCLMCLKATITESWLTLNHVI